MTSTFPAAPLDLLARGATLLVWSMAAFGAVLAVAAALRGDVGPALGGTAAFGLIGLIALGARAVQPVGYDLGPSGLVVRRRHLGPRSYPGAVEIVAARRPFHARDMRLLGSGGLYGYTGRFSLYGIGRARAHVTAASRGVVVRAGETLVQLSPADRDGFVAAVGEAPDA